MLNDGLKFCNEMLIKMDEKHFFKENYFSPEMAKKRVFETKNSQKMQKLEKFKKKMFFRNRFAIIQNVF